MKNQKSLGNKGFSLVELIVVIAIMAVLMGVLAPTLIGNIEKSRESTDLQNLDTIRGAAVTALADENVYRDVMTAIGTNAQIVIDLGTDAKSASVASIGTVNSSTSFKDKMTEIVTSSVAMKSTAACAANNKVVIIISSSGAVTASVVDSSGNTVNCTKTKDENGTVKPLMSGAGASASTK